MTSAIENHIRKNETFKIKSTLQTSRNQGMTLLDDHLWDLYSKGTISKDTLLRKCQDPKELQQKLDFAQLGGGGDADADESASSGSTGLFGRKKGA